MQYADRILPVLFLILAAASDLQTRRIPNRLLVLVMGLKLLLFIMEAVRGQHTGMRELLMACARAGFFLLAMGILAWVGKGAFGMGDVKLLGVLALFCPFFGILRVLFYGCSMAAVISLILLTVGNKRGKDTLPFAPFLLSGYLLWMLTETVSFA